MALQNNSLWVLHRDPAQREALLRLVPGDLEVITGSPGEPGFSDPATPRPGAVVLGVGGDFELELNFVHRMKREVPSDAWILVADPRDAAEVERIFDTLAGAVLPWPPSLADLQGRVLAVLHRRTTPTLSQREERETLTSRFARWFPETELPGLLRTLDPALARIPLLIQGEPGTGRSLLARYIHTFAGEQGGDFIAISCSGAKQPQHLLSQIAGQWPHSAAATLFLEEAHRLGPDLQHRLCDWIEFGVPRDAGLPMPSERLRWIVAAGPPSQAALLAPRLTQSLSGHVLHLEPLRGRHDAIDHFVEGTLRAWASARGGAAHRFTPEALELLHAYPWPGNYRELEAVLTRSLSRSGSREIRGSDLRFDPIAPRSRRENGLPFPENSDAVREFTAPSEEPTSASMPGVLRSAGRELENPLTSIRTLTELMPEYHGDSEFRAQFQKIVDTDLDAIERVLRDIQAVAELARPKIEPIDAAALLDTLIDHHLQTIEARQIRIRKELDRDYPMAVGDPRLLEKALAGIVHKAIEQLPAGGSLFATSRSHADLEGRPSVLRILLRAERASQEAPEPNEHSEPGLDESSLDFVIAHAVLGAMGGRLALDTGNERETVIVIDLPAASFA